MNRVIIVFTIFITTLFSIPVIFGIKLIITGLKKNRGEKSELEFKETDWDKYLDWRIYLG